MAAQCDCNIQQSRSFAPIYRIETGQANSRILPVLHIRSPSVTRSSNRHSFSENRAISLSRRPSVPISEAYITTVPPRAYVSRTSGQRDRMHAQENRTIAYYPAYMYRTSDRRSNNPQLTAPYLTSYSSFHTQRSNQARNNEAQPEGILHTEHDEQRSHYGHNYPLTITNSIRNRPSNVPGYPKLIIPNRGNAAYVNRDRSLAENDVVSPYTLPHATRTSRQNNNSSTSNIPLNHLPEIHERISYYPNSSNVIPILPAHQINNMSSHIRYSMSRGYAIPTTAAIGNWRKSQRIVNLNNNPPLNSELLPTEIHTNYTQSNADALPDTTSTGSSNSLTNRASVIAQDIGSMVTDIPMNYTTEATAPHEYKNSIDYSEMPSRADPLVINELCTVHDSNNSFIFSPNTTDSLTTYNYTTTTDSRSSTQSSHNLNSNISSNTEPVVLLQTFPHFENVDNNYIHHGVSDIVTTTVPSIENDNNVTYVLAENNASNSLNERNEPPECLYSVDSFTQEEIDNSYTRSNPIRSNPIYLQPYISGASNATYIRVSYTTPTEENYGEWQLNMPVSRVPRRTSNRPRVSAYDRNNAVFVRSIRPRVVERQTQTRQTTASEEIDVESVIQVHNVICRSVNGLPQNLILRLPEEKFSCIRIRSEDQKECNICQMEYEENELLRRLPCWHAFHSKCIDKWLENRKTCPLCRFDVEHCFHYEEQPNQNEEPAAEVSQSIDTTTSNQNEIVNNNITNRFSNASNWIWQIGSMLFNPTNTNTNTESSQTVDSNNQQEQSISNNSSSSVAEIPSSIASVNINPTLLTSYSDNNFTSFPVTIEENESVEPEIVWHFGVQNEQTSSNINAPVLETFVDTTIRPETNSNSVTIPTEIIQNENDYNPVNTPTNIMSCVNETINYLQNCTRTENINNTFEPPSEILLNRKENNRENYEQKQSLYPLENDENENVNINFH